MTYECPCCHGRGHLIVYDEADPTAGPTKLPCVHCDGHGTVISNMLHRDRELYMPSTPKLD
jgi:DnaJ-class molecular chaperone